MTDSNEEDNPSQWQYDMNRAHSSHRTASPPPPALLTPVGPLATSKQRSYFIGVVIPPSKLARTVVPPTSLCEPSFSVVFRSGAWFDITPQFDQLFKWIFERHRIATRRSQGKPPPWTKDLVMRSYPFCCVFREQDRNSQYLITHIINTLVEEIEAKGDWDTNQEEYNREFVFRCASPPPFFPQGGSGDNFTEC